MESIITLPKRLIVIKLVVVLCLLLLFFVVFFFWGGGVHNVEYTFVEVHSICRNGCTYTSFRKCMASFQSDCFL